MSERAGTEERVASQLPLIRPPEEDAALERAVALAAATAAGQPVPPRRAVRRRLTAVLAGAAALAGVALALSPAGAQVRDWIGDAVDGPPQPTRTTLGHIPGGGELLVQSQRGPWVVSADGSRRLLGDYDSATWSPRGLYVAVTKGRTLTAVEPDGDPHWSIEAPATIRDVRWSTSGQRIAYLARGDLHVVAGDGTGDFVLARGVARVAPAWMPVREGPYSPNVLAYVDAAGRLVTVDVDTGRQLSVAEPRGPVRQVDWLGHENVLLSGPHRIDLADQRGETARFAPPHGGRIIGVSLAGSEGRAVIVTRQPSSAGPRPQATLWVTSFGNGPHRYRRLFTGLGSFGPPALSPQGSSVLLPWRGADQWLFFDARVGSRAKPVAIGDIARQFAPGTPRGRAAFPSVDGWCCG